MKFICYGAAETVTGSMHLLEANGTRILFDCGLYQGKRQESFERNRHIPFDAASIDVLILSHAHLDHVGNIPSLVKSGFRGHIFCTQATADVARAMLLDSPLIPLNMRPFWPKRGSISSMACPNASHPLISPTA